MYFRNAVGKAVVNAAEMPNMPRYDSRNGSSVDRQPNDAGRSYNGNSDVTAADAALMKELYSELNTLLQKFVEQTLDEYEYVDSPIYNADGIDRETLAQLVSRVMDNALLTNDEFQEIELEAAEKFGFSRKRLLNSLIESLLLSDIFAVRRPRFRRLRSNYVYRDGRYDGIARQ